jgi:hypothetical protein
VIDQDREALHMLKNGEVVYPAGIQHGPGRSRAKHHAGEARFDAFADREFGRNCWRKPDDAFAFGTKAHGRSVGGSIRRQLPAMNTDGFAGDNILDQPHQRRRPPAAKRAVRMKAEHIQRFIRHLDATAGEILLGQRPAQAQHARPDFQRLASTGRDGAAVLRDDHEGPKYPRA